MAEAIVSSILEQITTIICQGVLEEERLLIGIKGDLRNLRNTLTSIRALLEVAEEKQISGGPVKLWLDRLKEESFDMEDALDEWRTVLLTDGAERACFLWRKVPVFLRYFSFHPVRCHRIARNIKEINGRLDKIAQEKDRYQLTRTKMISRLPSQRESKSFIDESSLLGREDVKNEIISRLLCETSKEEEGSPIQTISIVGMGGIGKTAVAQLVYNDENVKQHFTCKVWTYVSNNFEERKVAKDIIVVLQGIEKQATLQSLESVPLDALLDEVRKSIEGKKYLLVLDDVWTEKDKDFEGLNAAFKCGAPGSRILVTTRKNTVATIMGSSHTIELDYLSQEICWSIISKIALREKDQKTCEELKPVGLKIAEKCSGLPLVAKTFGGLLRFKTGIQGWENVLNSDLWRMGIIHKDVFVPLLLSYYDLPSPVRQCFTYFAFYDKRTSLLVCHMISVWMAEGYLGLDDDNSSLEQKGFEYLQCLMDRCFFQDFESKDGYLQIHDLVHDFALFLTRGECMRLEVPEDNRSSTTNQERTPRHLTVMVEKGFNFPEFIPDSEKLRSVVSYGSDDHAPVSEKAMHNLFNQARRLRVVDMVMGYHGSAITEEIRNLLHLRFLNLGGCRNLKRLPKALFRLHNLEHLNLCDCYNFDRLPDEIGSLVNLKHLCTTGCLQLACYPKGVVRLTRLTQLLGLIVRIDRDDPEEFSIGDLAKLNKLLVLSMKMVGNTINVDEAQKVKLQNLQEVKILVDGDITEAEHVILESLNMSSVPRYRFQTDYYMDDGFNAPRNECLYYSWA